MEVSSRDGPSTGENVIGAEEKLTLREVHQQRDEIASAALNLDVVGVR